MRRSFSLPLIAIIVVLIASPALCLIDINTASQSQLESLSGIGPVKSQRIIEGRPYRSIDELTRVKGIGPKTLEKLRDQITVGAPKKKARKKPVRKALGAIAKKIASYTTESYKTFRCKSCKNIFKVSSELKTGWCPYCRGRWALAGVKLPPTTAAPKAKPKKTTKEISWRDAERYLDQTKTVKGTIVGTHLSSRSGHLYLNFDPDYRRYVSIKISADDLSKFRSDAESYYEGKAVTAKGMIKKEGNYLRLLVTDPKDLQVAGKSATETKSNPPAKEPVTKKAEAPITEPGVISWRDAESYLDQTKTVQGTVVGTHLSRRSGNLYFNFSPQYRKYLSVKIPSADIGKFRSDAQSYYEGKIIKAKGTIKREKKLLRIIVTDPKDLTVVK